ncbi:two-component sensor histidine kinase [Luteitalea sp. TBR-22]|uniref:sensor histidine kinase n=1 Tax=Luteitalea sp. TBR-22 TaxID=2802971 RepID=UPI001AFABE4D|nr:HAMP domain-containing sensor histidine kinase [Luteitalea sp. TBR-22]BCS34813.1 two-component sensor histidine kinase [Luteitalea sp. TBR-22]
MSSRWPDALRDALGLRLALWYAAIFVASALTLVALTYVLLSASLRRYDRDTIETTLVQYGRAYMVGGVEELARELREGNVAATPGPLLVRLIGPGQQLTFFSMPQQWRRFDLSQLDTPRFSGEQTWTTLDPGDGGDELEVASVRLPDGTLLQVGRSTDRRRELLRLFRLVLLVDVAVVLVTALAGGLLITRSGLQPVRALRDTVRGIVETGRTDARVPPSKGGDTLGELGSLVNAMLDRIDRVVGGMRGALDNVAHDLRTPLTRLRGIAEEALASGDPERQRIALAECVEEADRVNAMLHSLMDISEAETGTMALRREPVPLAELVRQTVDMYEDAAEDGRIAIATHVEPALVVPVDRTRMRQVLANLLDNAIKYSPEDGHIVIRASEADGRAVLTVEDDGPGIPADELPRVWERLYRGDRSRSTRGLGLGLSLVKAIVEAHGGSVGVESAVGAGSRFEIRLPLTSSAAARS